MHNKRKNRNRRSLVARVIWVLLLVSAVIFAFIALMRPKMCVPITIVYSGEVDYYLPDIVKDFNGRSMRWERMPDSNSNTPLGIGIMGIKPICVSGYPVSAGRVRTEIIKPAAEQKMPMPTATPDSQNVQPATATPENQYVPPPTVWIPSVSTWLLLANQDAKRSIFDMTDAKATALAPVVIAIWQSRLDAIRQKVGYHDIGWEELLAVLTSPNGWCDYGLNPCRPAVYYGHTNPFNSPTGLSTLVSEFYASAHANGFTGSTLNLAAVNRPDIQLGVQEIEGLIRHYSDRTTEFIDYIAQGPDFVDFVALEENDVIAINQEHRPNGDPLSKLAETLVALYPKEGTFIHDHPFGIVHADWVTPEQQEAAAIFRAYLLTTKEQNIIMSKGFRPAVAGIPIAFPIDKDRGVDPNYPKTILALPDVNTLVAIQQSWAYVKKKADITLLIDISNSMNDDNKLTQAKTAALAFLKAMKNDVMQHDNRVGLTVFNDQVTQILPVDNLETREEGLIDAIRGLEANGNTALYDALVKTINSQSLIDCRNHIRAIILLSDGEDTSSKATKYQDARNAIATTQDSECPILVIVVAYGNISQFTGQTLDAIASSARTTRLNSDPSNIDKILAQIRGYF